MKDICGVVTDSGTMSWVCIRPVHAKVYEKNGRMIFSSNPSSDQHYFVRRYPDTA